MIKPMYEEQNVATCIWNGGFAAWVPLLPTCGAAMIAL